MTELWLDFGSTDNDSGHSALYDMYLASETWRALRVRILSRAHGRCERCSAPATEVHHSTYAHLGHELPQELLALCHSCHIDADEERAQRVEEESYARRLTVWATKVYGKDWEVYHDYGTVEERFERWLENRGEA